MRRCLRASRSSNSSRTRAPRRSAGFSSTFPAATVFCERGRWGHRIVQSVRTALLAASICLVTVVPRVASEAAPTGAVQVVNVIDAATIDVVTEAGVVQRFRLVGIASDFSEGVCGGEHARARAQQLLEGQSVTVELQEPAVVEDPPLVNVWLGDGQNLAEVLVREGDVLAAAAPAPNATASVSAAEAAAIADRVGIWAPGACQARDSSPGTVDLERAELGALVTSYGFALQRGRTAIEVLHEQARSAPLAGSTSEWQATTNLALGSMRRAAQELQAPVSTTMPVAQTLSTDLVALGREMADHAEAYSDSLAADAAGIQAAGSQLPQMNDRVASALAKVDAVAAAYAIGD
jgi:endonuclease YncB( thermonuclease family)